MSWVLSIDFGTTNTGAAMLTAHGQVVVVKLDPSSNTMPSAVVLTGNGVWRVGQAALNTRRAHPATFVGSPKARLGQEPQILGASLVPAPQIAARLLAAVRERAVAAAGGTPPDRVVLTHPVRWGPERLDALRESARLAGFDPARTGLLAEPVAALHAHLTPGSLPPGSRVVVVDMGGGTCDVSVLQATDSPEPDKNLLVVAQEGDDRLGGNDLDDALYGWVMTQLKSAGRADMVAMLEQPANLGAALTLLDVVRGAKQDLSEHADALIVVAVGGYETTLTITRDEYERLIAGHMARVAALVDRALRTSTTTRVTALFLTGGTAYTPALARALHPVVGLLAAPLGDPKLATAIGALHLVRQQTAGDAGSRPIHGGPVGSHPAAPAASAGGAAPGQPSDLSDRPSAKSGRARKLAVIGVAAVIILVAGAVLATRYVGSLASPPASTSAAGPSASTPASSTSAPAATAAESSAFVGNWTLDLLIDDEETITRAMANAYGVGASLEMRSDGSFTMAVVSDGKVEPKHVGTWTSTGDVATMTTEKGTIEATLHDGRLTFENDDGTTLVFVAL